MTWELAREIILDALKDSALVLAFVFLFHVILSLFEDKMANLLTRKKYTGPVFGSLFGIIPQCGTSVFTKKEKTHSNELKHYSFVWQVLF